MKIETRTVDDAIVVRLKGKITGGPEAKAFRDTFSGLIDEGHKNFVLDLQDVTWINSTGIGILLGAYTRIRKAGGDVVLTNVSRRVDMIFHNIKLNLVFLSTESVDQAIEQLHERRG